MTEHLDDIASDLSVFHRITDAGQMEAAVFFTLAIRLPAYQGVMASVAARQRDGGSARRQAGHGYERTSPQANNARAAETAPPSTAQSLAAINAQLGATWFSHRTVKAGPGE